MTLAYNEFMLGLLNDPAAVSAPTPSGATLSKRIASMLDPVREGSVVELGPGTGVVTEALIQKGYDQRRLILVESNSYFCDLLQRKFPRAKLFHGDAFHLDRYLSRERVAGIVSGVPLLNFPPDARRSLVERALDLQNPGGRFVQLSYGWRPAVAPNAKLRVDRTIVWRNLPPACIWNYSLKR